MIKYIIFDAYGTLISTGTGSIDATIKILEDKNVNIKNIFTSESMQIYKPKPEFYKKILDKMRAGINEVLFVGDSLIDDVLGPQKLGIKTCWINRKKYS